jgi:hypothetical protein
MSCNDPPGLLKPLEQDVDKTLDHCVQLSALGVFKSWCLTQARVAVAASQNKQ